MKQLIRKILKEESLKQDLLGQIKQDGVYETSKLVGGIDILLNVLGIEEPMDFLHLFDDLDVVQSEEKPDWTLFRYKPKHNFIIYNRERGRRFDLNYDEIWSVFEEHFGLNYNETERLTQEWLSEVYNLRDFTTGFYYPMKTNMVV